MTDDSGRIKELFAASVCDVTPDSARPVARVLYSPFSSDSEVTNSCRSVLSDDELHRADRFAAHRDKALFVQRRAFRRFCAACALGSMQPLSQIDFRETEKGRPYLAEQPDLWFSFTSCRLAFAGAWSRTHGVGIDLEDQTRGLEAADIAFRFFSGTEADAVAEVTGSDRRRGFFQLWTLKEAALKSIGEGLPFGLDAFEFELDPSPRIVDAPLGYGGPERFVPHFIEGLNVCAALVTRTAI